MTNESNSKVDIETVRQSYQQLLSQTESLILATINADGTPLTSYASFVLNEQRQFYIFTSQLAAHTANLQRTGQASVMLIEDVEIPARFSALQTATQSGSLVIGFGQAYALSGDRFDTITHVDRG